jgi:hypothetical protein
MMLTAMVMVTAIIDPFENVLFKENFFRLSSKIQVEKFILIFF